MLYDRRWDKTETKTDPFKLETLIGWLLKQPPDTGYDYVCNGRCLLAKYFSAHGYKNVVMHSYGFEHADGQEYLPYNFNDIAIQKPRTFGGALTRALARL